MKNCPNCGAENKDDVKKCFLCVYEFESEEETDKTNTDDNLVTKQEKANESYESASSDRSKAIIIVLIVIIVVASLAVGGILFMNNRNADKKGKPVSEVSNVEIKTNETSSQMPATNVVTEQTMETKDSISTTTAQVQHIDTMEAAKRAMYAHYDEQFQMEQNDSYGFDFFDRDAQYAMYDVNSDGIDELFISYENVESTGSDLYIYKDGEYIKSHSFYSGADVCLSEHLLCEKVYGGGEMTKIYVISDNSILQKDEISELYNEEFYHNDFVISEQEYYNLMSEYDAMDWIHIPDNSDHISDLIDISIYDQQTVDNINNGFTFFDSVEYIKSYLTEYKLLDEYDSLGISNDVKHILHYQYPSQGNNEIILGLCFVDDKLIGINWGIWNNSYSVSDMYNIIKNNIISQYGEPNDCSDVTASWYVDPFGPGTSYWLYNFGDGVQISYFVEDDAEYEKTSLLPIDISSVPFIIDDVTNKYTTYDTSAAGNDFSFFNEPYSREVITENDPLNLRAAPSTSADIVIKMPKGSPVTLYGSNSGGVLGGISDGNGWCYISYTENGITYYGYASSEFIGLP